MTIRTRARVSRKGVARPARPSPLFGRPSFPLLGRASLSLTKQPQAEQSTHTNSGSGANFNFGNIPVLSPNATTVQPKLTIGRPNDKYEQEADRVADRVMTMPQPGIQRQGDVAEEEEDKEKIQTKPLSQSITPLIQRQSDNAPEEDEEEKETLQAKPLLQRQEGEGEKEEEEEDKTLQASAASGQASAVTSGVASGVNAMRGGGQPLSPATRSFMEPRFGHDFSRVRVHDDRNAANVAKKINARAFTVGQNIAFGAGQYQPGTPHGNKLLAHELTHVVQQGHGAANNIRRSPIPISHSGPRLMRWSRSGVLGILCKDPDGPATVNILKNYKVYSYTSYTYTRQYYTDASKTKKKGKLEPHSINGYHQRSKKEIGLLKSRTNKKAASTLLHEVVHAKQHMDYEAKKKIDPKAKAPTKAEKEYGAHIKQEEFNIRNKIKPKHSSFRKKVGKNWVVDVAAIKTWVDRVYGIGPAKHYTNSKRKMTGKTGPLKPWKCTP